MTKEQADFWKKYEAETGEKVLCFTLGKYLSGFDEVNGQLWGLLILTESAFRFHHFPNDNWITSLFSGSRKPEKEITFMIPREKIINAEFIFEKRIWKKILFPSMPVLELRYIKDDCGEAVLKIESEMPAREIAEKLSGH